MSILIKDKKLKKDIVKVRSFSSLVEKRLEKIQKSDEDKVSKLTAEELQDFNKILQITDYLLCKYEHKKEVHSLLKDFVSMVHTSTDSLDVLHDNIDELVLAADGTIKRIKEMQTDVADTFNIDAVLNSEKAPEIEAEKSGNNLTKSSTPAYTQEYQPKSTVESEQVI